MVFGEKYDFFSTFFSLIRVDRLGKCAIIGAFRALKL